MQQKIAINEIFTSIDGEVNRYGQGGLTTFIRFSGCSLRCPYCDTKQAQNKLSGALMTIDEIIQQIKTPRVTITGGEPLEQIEGFKTLMYHLLSPFDSEYLVSIETNGTIEIPFDEFLYAGRRIGWVIDYKLDYDTISPYRNFKNAGKGDWIKIIIGNNDRKDPIPKTVKDYQLAKDAFNNFRKLGTKARFAIGFVNPKRDAKHVVKWLVDDQIFDIHLNIQLHKFIDMK